MAVKIIEQESSEKIAVETTTFVKGIISALDNFGKNNEDFAVNAKLAREFISDNFELNSDRDNSFGSAAKQMDNKDQLNRIKNEVSERDAKNMLGEFQNAPNNSVW